MPYPVFIIGLILALVFSLIYALGFKRNRVGINTWIFFFVIFIAVSVVGLWIVPDNKSIWTVKWTPMFFIAVILFILLAASVRKAPKTRRKAFVEIREEKKLSLTLNIILWIIIALALLIILLNLY